MPAPGRPADLLDSARAGTGTPRPVRRGVLRRGVVARAWDTRLSHAERATVTDELSRHFSDGRLDDDEFSRRLDQALKARTYRDLAGLLHDLAHPDAPAADARLALGVQAAYARRAGGSGGPGLLAGPSRLPGTAWFGRQLRRPRR